MGRETSKQVGFTIVELLIVIVVIAILAAITIVAFNGVQQRAQSTTLSSDLSGAARHMEIARVNSTDESFPSTMPPGVKASQGVVLQLTQTSSNKTFCMNAYRSSPYMVSSYDSATKTTRPYLCPGATVGSAVGGVAPTAPRGVNLAADLSVWPTTGGVTFSNTTNELSFSGAGNSTSPLIRVDAPTSVSLKAESLATTASTYFTPDSGVHFSAFYYGADGTTPATNSIGYTSNGNAQGTPLSSWTTRTWTTPAGPGVVYIKFMINSSPSNYTSNNRMRAVTVVAN